ncbi:MAG: ABC transporter substrate-binding protein [Sulfolobales archaeon]
MKTIYLIAFIIVALVLGFVAGMIVTSYGRNPSETQLSQICSGYKILDKIKQKGVLTVGTSADWPPYEYVTSSGEFAGIDIEIAKKIAQSLGVKLEIKDMKFAALFEAVKRGDVDMAIADIAMKPERLQAVDFSIPYRCETGKAIIMRISDAGSYKDLQSLYGKNIGVQLGTTEQDLVEQYYKDKANIVTFDRVYPEMVMALKTGRLNAIVTAPDVAELIVSKEKDLKIVGYIPFFSCSVIALPKCSFDLQMEVSKIIWNMIQSGEIKKIIDNEMSKWLSQQS